MKSKKSKYTTYAVLWVNTNANFKFWIYTDPSCGPIGTLYRTKEAAIAATEDRFGCKLTKAQKATFKEYYVTSVPNGEKGCVEWKTKVSLKDVGMPTSKAK